MTIRTQLCDMPVVSETRLFRGWKKGKINTHLKLKDIVIILTHSILKPQIMEVASYNDFVLQVLSKLHVKFKRLLIFESFFTPKQATFCKSPQVTQLCKYTTIHDPKVSRSIFSLQRNYGVFKSVSLFLTSKSRISILRSKRATSIKSQNQ